jgi:uncharacterized membrane protein
MNVDPLDLTNMIRVGPVVIDFGKDHWMEIVAAIVVVLAIYLGMRLIDRHLPRRKDSQ